MGKELKTVEERLGYRALTTDYDSDEIFENAYTSDLLSDVMGNCPEEAVLITIQAHKNSVAVGTLTGVKAIILCNGRQPDSDMIEAARNEEIALFGTSDNQYTASWKIHGLLDV